MQKFASAVCSQTFSADRNLLGLLLLCYSTLISLLTFAKPASNFPISRCFQKSPNFQALFVWLLKFAVIQWRTLRWNFKGRRYIWQAFLGFGVGLLVFLLLFHFTAVKMLWLTWCTARKIPRYHKPCGYLFVSTQSRVQQWPKSLHKAFQTLRDSARRWSRSNLLQRLWCALLSIRHVHTT